jgi:hypothetical protein
MKIRSQRLALPAITAILMVIAEVGVAVAASPAATTDHLERYWRQTYKPRAPAARDGRHIPLLAKAAPDECYGGVGATYVAKTSADCPSGRQPKVNQAYLWGLTKGGSDLWFGTAPNTLCLVLGEIISQIGSVSSFANDAWTCEFGQSGYRASLGDPSLLDPKLGDWRPPKIYRYRIATGTVEDLGVALTGEHLDRLNTTLGIRSAGSLGRTVLLAGPTLGTGGISQPASVNVFAFDAITGEFISSTTLPEYSDIRRWIVVGGDLYTAVGKATGGGALLRWNGDPEAPSTAEQPSPSLFDFDEVGSLPTEGADLTEHQGRIYVTTWPVVGQDVVTAGLYRSPEVSREGLPASNAQLEEIWTVDDYEPDPITARTYLGGAVGSFDGKLVWGTMHAPFVGALMHLREYLAEYGGTPSVLEVLAAIAGAHRPTVIFSADDLEGTEPQIRVLYGNTLLPAYVPGAGWRLVPNKAHQLPKFGLAGFNNPFNTYTWAMGATDRGLYVGTMDWSYLLAKGIPTIVDLITGTTASTTVSAEALQIPMVGFGADLMRFASMRRPALSISRSGVGNFANYGIRTMVAEPHRLYLGTANPMNLLPQGGWELRRVGPRDPTSSRGADYGGAATDP